MILSSSASFERAIFGNDFEENLNDRSCGPDLNARQNQEFNTHVCILLAGYTTMPLIVL